MMAAVSEDERRTAGRREDAELEATTAPTSGWSRRDGGPPVGVAPASLAARSAGADMERTTASPPAGQRVSPIVDMQRTTASLPAGQRVSPIVDMQRTTAGLPAEQRASTIGDMERTTASLPQSTAPAEPLRELGRYLIVKQLGAGGMGVVYKAYDPDLDRKVAIKLLRGPAVTEARARLLREAQAMAKLSHPNVVPIFDVGLHEGQIFIAMDFVDGIDMRAWIAAPRPWTEVVDVFAQAGAGLAAAHAVGLIHRDFKPK